MQIDWKTGNIEWGERHEKSKNKSKYWGRIVDYYKSDIQTNGCRSGYRKTDGLWFTFGRLERYLDMKI